MYQFCNVKIFSTNKNRNLVMLDDPGRVRSHIINVVCQIQRFDFDCNLVVTRKVIIACTLTLKCSFHMIQKTDFVWENRILYGRNLTRPSYLRRRTPPNSQRKVCCSTRCVRADISICELGDDGNWSKMYCPCGQN